MRRIFLVLFQLFTVLAAFPIPIEGSANRLNPQALHQQFLNQAKIDKEAEFLVNAAKHLSGIDDPDILLIRNMLSPLGKNLRYLIANWKKVPASFEDLMVELSHEEFLTKGKNPKKLQWIPGTYQILPISFYSSNLELNINSKELIFSFRSDYIDPKEKEKHETAGHVPYSLGYARFLVDKENRAAIVFEIQSDSWKHLSKTQKKQHRHWHKQLMIAFQVFVERNLSDQVDRVLVGGEAYQKDVWDSEVQQTNSISEETLRSIYGRALPWLNFSKMDCSHIIGQENFESAINWKEEKWANLGDCYGHSIESFRESHFYQLKQFFRNVDSGKRRLFLGKNEYSFLSDLGKKSKYSFPSLAGVKGKKLKISSEIPYLSKELVDVFNVIKESSNRVPRGLVDQGFLAKENSGSEIFTGSYQFKPSTITTQSRHSRVNAEVLGEFISVGYKGSGSLKFENYDHDMLGEGISIPIRVSKKTEKTTVIIGSHDVWGGYLRDEANVEIVNTLAIHKLSLDYFGQLAPANKPLAVMKLTDLGYWQDEKFTKISAEEYRKRFFPTEFEHTEFYQYVNLTDTPYRIDLIIEVILNKNSFDSFEILKDMIRHLWLAHSELPTAEINRIFDSLEKKPLSDVKSRIEWLNDLHQKFRNNHEKIYQKIENALLSMVGLVHSLDGHLGGEATMMGDFDKEENQFQYYPLLKGAINGGPLAYRNMKITGMLMDLDDQVSIPGSPFFDDEVVKESPETHKYFQKLDLMHLESSLYWIRMLLKGRELDKAEMLKVNPLGDPGSSIMLIGMSDIDPREERKKYGVFTKNRFRISRSAFINPDLADLYFQFHAENE